MCKDRAIYYIIFLAVLELFLFSCIIWNRKDCIQNDFSMERLLKTSILPVGKTMYVWGGGWNKEDTGAGTEAVSVGLSKQWERFAAAQTADYDYNETRYQIHDGLDCSGYIGWLVYNVFYHVDGQKGFVMGASRMAQTFADYGFGTYLKDDVWKPGDICSMDGHVWMSLGQCTDGSVLLVHASPPGVRICGTMLADGEKSEAVVLAENVMQTYYPDWYARYSECGVPYFYLTDSVKMRWYQTGDSDPGHLQEKTAEEIVRYLYEE